MAGRVQTATLAKDAPSPPILRCIRPERRRVLSFGSPAKLATSPIRRSEPLAASIDAAINFDDLRRLAKRRLPKIAYDFIEGGLEDEAGIARNASAFEEYRLVPRYC
ncbi:MAG TPA: alpha-hydroxy-acid oxidizing protein, partial [Hyphomicrobiaceae bacterium]|nr:alpha-hydroxy-acid oxidizing protein [Hyphomicrobiaceae bacterium]